jgi:hypothetical protein
MKAGMLLVSLILLQTAGLASLDVEDNTLSSEYCVLSCDASEAYVEMNSTVSFGDWGTCILIYSDLSGSDGTVTLTLTSPVDLDGVRAMLTVYDGMSRRDVTATFDGTACTFAFGAYSGSETELSCTVPGIRGLAMDMDIQAQPSDPGCTAHWSL